MDLNLNLNDPEQIKKLITALQGLLPSDQEQGEVVESKIKTKTSRASSNKKSKNKFLEMAEKDMHKSDSAIDKKLSVSPPTPRNRKFIPLEVRCRSCGKMEKVNPAMVPESKDRYKCNKCSSSAGE
jgi:hypothetical protein